MLKHLRFLNISYKSFTLLAFIFAFVSDQVSKMFFYFYFSYNESILHNKSINVTSFFSFTFVWNTGMSFSIFSSQHYMLNVFISSLAFLVLLVILLKYFNTKSIYFAVALGLLLAGSLGNIVDRIRFYAVIDFLHFHYKGYSFPVFNLADVFINFAVVLILFDQYKKQKKVKKNER